MFDLGRHIRGNRARGGALPQHASAAEGLNAAELKGNGVKVETLKKLMLSGEEPKESPPKLISLDQVTVRGEDLTGKVKSSVHASHYNNIHTYIHTYV